MNQEAQQNASTVFDAIRELVGLPAGEPRFWSLFVESVAGLCRSPVCRIFKKEGEKIREVKSWKEDAFPNGFRHRGVELTGRLEKREYIFEPFSLGKVPGLEEPFILVFRFSLNEETVFVAVISEHKDVGRFNEVVVRSQLIAA